MLGSKNLLLSSTWKGHSTSPRCAEKTQNSLQPPPPQQKSLAISFTETWPRIKSQRQFSFWGEVTVGWKDSLVPFTYGKMGQETRVVAQEVKMGDSYFWREILYLQIQFTWQRKTGTVGSPVSLYRRLQVMSSTHGRCFIRSLVPKPTSCGRLQTLVCRAPRRARKNYTNRIASPKQVLCPGCPTWAVTPGPAHSGTQYLEGLPPSSFFPLTVLKFLIIFECFIIFILY